MGTWDVDDGRKRSTGVVKMEEVAESALRVTIAPGRGRAMLARDVLARAFGLEGAEAERLLARGGTLSGRAPSLALLRLLGVQADLSTEAPRFDLSLRLGDPEVEGPAGIVLEDLPQEAAQATARALRGDGVQVTLAPHLGALYDVFAPARGPLPEALRQYLKLLGAGETEGPALVAGLEAQVARLVTARFRALGLIAVHQAFQRFDLWVTGSGRLSLREAADFLAARGMGDPGALARGVRVERGLTRAAARQFLNDYRHIGLPARLTLCGMPA